MDKILPHSTSVGSFVSYFPSDQWINYGEDFAIVNMKYREGMDSPVFEYPCRFDGYFLIYCVKGSLKLNVDMTEYELKENMLFLAQPDNIVRISEIVEDIRNQHYVGMLISRSLIECMKVDMRKMICNMMKMQECPYVTLNQEEADLMADFMNLAGKIISSGLVHSGEALNSLLSSSFYVMISSLDRQVLSNTDEHEPSSRSKTLLSNFIKLVSEHYTQHRNVGFYADKLCLTPKYLSKLIKVASGRSAPDWIDSYVILEAKNLLKYSEMTIKEIVYHLNFPNQSVFYKFFKARTGLTPSEYRKR